MKAAWMQDLIVTAIVVYAAFVVARKYAPAPLRRTLARAWLALQLQAGAGLAGAAARLGLHGWAQALRARLQQRAERAAQMPESAPAGACGGCSGCSGCASAQPKGRISADALKQTIRRL